MYILDNSGNISLALQAMHTQIKTMTDGSTLNLNGCFPYGSGETPVEKFLTGRNLLHGTDTVLCNNTLLWGNILPTGKISTKGYTWDNVMI